MHEEASEGGMVCPSCGSFNSLVKDSRQKKGFISRRRVCAGCGARWTTVEIPEDQFKTLMRTPVHWAKRSRTHPGFVSQYYIPDDKQIDVQNLRNKGFNMIEMAAMLGLRRRKQSKGTEDG